MTQFDSGRPDMWMSFALISALLLGVRRVYEKKLSVEFGNFSLSFATLAFSLPFILLLFIVMPLPRDIGALPGHFWWPLIVIWLILYPLQNYFLYRSLREGELSEVTPVSSLLPVFNIATSFIVLGEAPSALGYVGIVITVIATYLLLTDVEGFRGQRFNAPVLMMVGSVLCTALGSTLDKAAIEVSTPIFYIFLNVLGGSVVFFALSIGGREGGDLKKIPRYAGMFAILGLVFALAFASFAAAFALGPTSYTLALRSGGFILAALWGLVFLHESLSRRKIIALLLFVLGTVLLALG